MFQWFANVIHAQMLLFEVTIWGLDHATDACVWIDFSNLHYDVIMSKWLPTLTNLYVDATGRPLDQTSRRMNDSMQCNDPPSGKRCSSGSSWDGSASAAPQLTSPSCMTNWSRRSDGSVMEGSFMR